MLRPPLQIMFPVDRFSANFFFLLWVLHTISMQRKLSLNILAISLATRWPESTLFFKGGLKKVIIS